jgi:hypothetical protein
MTKQQLEKLLMSPDETSATLGVKKETLAIWRIQGKNLPFVKIGRSIMYKTADIMNFIDGATRTSTACES